MVLNLLDYRIVVEQPESTNHSTSESFSLSLTENPVLLVTQTRAGVRAVSPLSSALGVQGEGI